MTDQITVPRATWDAMREALDELADLVEASLKGEYTPDSFTTQPARTAITAAASVSHPKPETTPPQEGGAITAESAANAIHPQATEPAGYKLVPVKPTPEMIAAAEQVEAAWRAGWAACRDAEYVGQEAEDEAWGMSETCANADWESAAPKALEPQPDDSDVNQVHEVNAQVTYAPIFYGASAPKEPTQ